MPNLPAKTFLLLSGILLVLLVLVSAGGQADPISHISGTEKKDSEKLKQYPEQEWGVGFVVRTAKIPFDTKDDWVTSLVPLMFYDGKTFFLDGMEGGIKLKYWDNSRLDFLGRFRFFDIPREYQNLIQEDTVDFGFRYRYELWDQLFADAEFRP